MLRRRSCAVRRSAASRARSAPASVSRSSGALHLNAFPTSCFKRKAAGSCAAASGPPRHALSSCAPIIR